MDIKGLIKLTKKSKPEVTKAWNKAKKIVTSKLRLEPSDNNYQDVLVGLAKKELGLKEDILCLIGESIFNSDLKLMVIKKNIFEKREDWVSTAYGKWDGKPMNASQIAKSGGVSKVAVGNAVKGIFDKLLKKMAKDHPDEKITTLVIMIMDVLGIPYSEMKEISYSLPKWAIAQMKKELRR